MLERRVREVSEVDAIAPILLKQVLLVLIYHIELDITILLNLSGHPFCGLKRLLYKIHALHAANGTHTWFIVRECADIANIGNQSWLIGRE